MQKYNREGEVRADTWNCEWRNRDNSLFSHWSHTNPLQYYSYFVYFLILKIVEHFFLKRLISSKQCLLKRLVWPESDNGKHEVFLDFSFSRTCSIMETRPTFQKKHISIQDFPAVVFGGLHSPGIVLVGQKCQPHPPSQLKRNNLPSSNSCLHSV